MHQRSVSAQTHRAMCYPCRAFQRTCFAMPTAGMSDFSAFHVDCFTGHRLSPLEASTHARTQNSFQSLHYFSSTHMYTRMHTILNTLPPALSISRNTPALSQTHTHCSIRSTHTRHGMINSYHMTVVRKFSKEQ